MKRISDLQSEPTGNVLDFDQAQRERSNKLRASERQECPCEAWLLRVRGGEARRKFPAELKSGNWTIIETDSPQRVIEAARAGRVGLIVVESDDDFGIGGLVIAQMLASRGEIPEGVEIVTMIDIDPRVTLLRHGDL